MFHLLVGLVAALAGSIAAVAGFGIGSLLTPVLALRFGTKLAVAIVSVPHLAGTAWRFLSLRKHVDRVVLIRFGVLSAIGGLVGALLNAWSNNPLLTIIFAALLFFTGFAALTGFTRRMRFGRKTAWVAGGVSGLFGGMVGNQGGLRSAALLGFNIPRESFVATATAIGLVVDGARMPVYVATQRAAVAGAWQDLAVATAGVLIGTIWGVKILHMIPEIVFRRTVAVLVLLLGVYMLIKGIHGFG